jgi:hypothetical protein
MALTKVRGAGAEGLTLSSTALTVANGLTLTDGNVTLASGHGVDFGATGDGTGANQAELLDDYEEGTWTPSLTNGTSATVANARYTKIGQMVYAGAYLSSVSIPNNSSVTFIAGLPFTVAGSNAYHAGGSITYLGAFNITSFHMLSPTPNAGGTNLYFHRGDGSNSQVVNSQLTGLTSIIFSVIYTSD